MKKEERSKRSGRRKESSLTILKRKKKEENKEKEKVLDSIPGRRDPGGRGEKGKDRNGLIPSF